VCFKGSKSCDVRRGRFFDEDIAKSLTEPTSPMAQDNSPAGSSKILYQKEFTTSIDYGRPKTRELLLSDDQLIIKRGKVVIYAVSIKEEVLLVMCHKRAEMKVQSDVGAISVFWIIGNPRAAAKLKKIKIFFGDEETLTKWTVLLTKSSLVNVVSTMLFTETRQAIIAYFWISNLPRPCNL
jgi:hypothetical protein